MGEADLASPLSALCCAWAVRRWRRRGGDLRAIGAGGAEDADVGCGGGQRNGSRLWAERRVGVGE